MRSSPRIAMFVLWLVSLVGVGVVTRLTAQTPLTVPTMVFGHDIGFRVEGQDGPARRGTLMIRLNGRWVEARATRQPPPFRVFGNRTRDEISRAASDTAEDDEPVR